MYNLTLWVCPDREEEREERERNAGRLWSVEGEARLAERGEGMLRHGTTKREDSFEKESNKGRQDKEGGGKEEEIWKGEWSTGDD